MAALADALNEIYKPAAELVRSDLYVGLGLTDAGIDRLADSGTVVLTDDFELGGRIEQRGLEVLNLRRMRSVRLE